MADVEIITTLRSSRDEIERSIVAYEKKLDQARRDLVHVMATLAMFETSGDDRHMASYIDTHRLFARGDMARFVQAELARGEALDTRELSRRLAMSKGLDGGDKVLCRAISYRLVRVLLLQERQGKISTPGKVKGVRVWAARQYGLSAETLTDCKPFATDVVMVGRVGYDPTT
ncbi:hypothetical protein [Lichenihabitans psoromatis]|uniref:hypothetical protein n=1 Tax=Lichenihabitans psoromatis TaxID=2528642 RepID=UPI0010383012|nr:hypothetical protein [Lichenihabitans psoromatis]